MMENIHSETYSLLIDTYIKDTVQCMYLFNTMDIIPCIKHKANWALHSSWISDQHLTFAERLVTFGAVEGIVFSSWKHTLMSGLTFSNGLISCNKGMCTDFACLLFSQLKCRPHPHTVQWVITEAVKIEQELLTGKSSINYSILYTKLHLQMHCLNDKTSE
ncbi:Ribonucleotide reductase small subunit [Tylopilus felleus]